MDINKKAYATNTEMLLICLFMYMYNFFLQICRTACLYTKKNTIHITNQKKQNRHREACVEQTGYLTNH